MQCRHSPLDCVSGENSWPRRGIIFAILWLAGAHVGLATLAGTQREVPIYVSVTTSTGTPVRGLTANDFVVQVRDVPRPVARVEAPPSQPMAIVVATAGIRDEMTLPTRRVLDQLVTELGRQSAGARMGLMLDDAGPRAKLGAVSEQRDTLKAVIDHFFRTPTTVPLENAVVDGAAALALERSDHRVLLIIAASRETDLSLPIDRLVDALRDARAVPWIMQVLPTQSTGSAVAGVPTPVRVDQSLRAMSIAAGGWFEQIVGDRAFELAGPRMAETLLSQYAVYVPVEDADRLPAPIRVGVTHPGSAPVRVVAPRSIGR